MTNAATDTESASRARDRGRVTVTLLHCVVPAPSAVPFERQSVRVFGKWHPQPRLTKWYAARSYTYSGLSLPACDLPPDIEALRVLAERLTGGRYNSVLCNLYQSGADTVGWHSDDEAIFGADPEVASFSFGAAREFQMRHKRTGERQSFSLGEGSLLHMGRGVQREWQHRVPRTTKPVGSRVNLTFRWAT